MLPCTMAFVGKRQTRPLAPSHLAKVSDLAARGLLFPVAVGRWKGEVFLTRQLARTNFGPAGVRQEDRGHDGAVLAIRSAETVTRTSLYSTGRSRLSSLAPLQ